MRETDWSARDYLSLGLARLERGEEWGILAPGLLFVFVTQGAGTYRIGPQSISSQVLRQGDVLVCNAASAVKVVASREVPLVLRHFCVRFEHLFPVFTSQELGHLSDLGEAFKVPRVFEASSTLAVECHRVLREAPSEPNLEQRGRLLLVVCAVLSKTLAQADQQHGEVIQINDRQLQEFAKLPITELVSLSVGDLAQKLGCDRRQLNRLFRRHFGLSVATLKMEIRLLRAASLLRDLDAKIIVVAEECGFNHLGLFNTLFKRRFGVTPSQWRKTFAPGLLPEFEVLKTSESCHFLSRGLCPWCGDVTRK